MSESHPAEDFNALLDAAVDGIVLIDRSGTIQGFNRAASRLFGYLDREVLGRNVAILMPEPEARAHAGYIAEYLRTGDGKVIGRGREVIARRKDGSQFPAFLSIGVVQGSAPPRFIGFVQDRTQQRQAQEETRRLHERLWHVSRLASLGEMASGLAHELNQPLAAIANYAQACDRLLGSPSADLREIREALREVTAQAVRAGEIIRRLRRLASPPDFEARPTDINALILELLELTRTSGGGTEPEYRLDLASGLPLLLINPEQIQQVIYNLARNAVEAVAGSGGRRGLIVVRTTLCPDGEVEISVCDNGPGVAATVADSLFTPFCTSKAAGTGLGLALSRTIVKRHRGTLDYSPNPGGGACFIVRLPSAQTA